jgi:hypothetical protein
MRRRPLGEAIVTDRYAFLCAHCSTKCRASRPRRAFAFLAIRRRRCWHLIDRGPFIVKSANTRAVWRLSYIGWPPAFRASGGGSNGVIHGGIAREARRAAIAAFNSDPIVRGIIGSSRIDSSSPFGVLAGKLQTQRAIFEVLENGDFSFKLGDGLRRGC